MRQSRFLLQLLMGLIKLALLTLFVVTLGLFVVFRPTYATKLTYQGKAISISRDEFHIPTIHAQSWQSYLYAVGYVYAEDRLFQINLRRLVVQGRLSEFLGESSLRLDSFFRQINLKGWAKRTAQRLKAQNLTEYRGLMAHAQGINDQAASRKALPLDFYISGIEWEEWTVESILGIMKLLEWSLSPLGIDELIRSSLLENHTKEEALRLLPAGNEEDWAFKSKTIIQDEDIPERLTTRSRSERVNSDFDPQIVRILGELGDTQFLNMGEGSNAWAVSGRHTQSGKPILTYDPHLQNGIPTQWIQIHATYKHKGEWHSVSGVSPPGIPAILGRNQYGAAACTVIYMDNQDFYKEKVEGDKYLINGQWKSLKLRKQVIKVRGMADEVMMVKQTHRGPIINSLVTPYGTYYVQGDLSLSWTGFHDEHLSFIASLHMPESKTLQEWTYFLSYQSKYYVNFNLVFATEDGHIGSQELGIHPIRRNPDSGLFVKDGTTTKDDWVGFKPSQDRLQVIDPKSGYIVSANNKVASSSYYNDGHRYHMYTARADRITELLEASIEKGEKFDVGKMKEIQLDTVDVYCRQILPVLVKLIPETKNQNQIGDFTCNFSRQSYQATVYQRLFYEIHRLSSPFPANNMSYLSIHSSHQRVFKFIRQSEHDAQKTSIIIKAWKNTVQHLSEWFRTQDRQQWKWGEYHRDLMPHLPFTNSLLAPIFDRSFPGSGNMHTVNVGKMNKVEFGNFEVSHRANYRAVYDLSSRDNDWWIIDTGISELVFSKHYDDQTQIFSRDQMIPIRSEPQNVQNLDQL